MTTPVTNPSTFTIVDPNTVKEGITGFNVKFGKTSGSYTLTAPVPAKDLTALASGTITAAIADLNQQLAPGTWFSVATATNPTGESPPSPETSFIITPPQPSSPTSFSVA